MVADVVVAGAGVIALAAAVELADRGAGVVLVGTTHNGDASSASAGMLAPSVERELGPVHAFAMASRDIYPGWVAALTARTGVDVPLARSGVLVAALDDAEAAALRSAIDAPSSWLEWSELRELEPAISPDARGAAWHPDDGAVDPLRLLDALRAAVARHGRISVVSEDVAMVRTGDAGAAVRTDRERWIEGGHLVLAAGAWTPLIEGVRPLPIEPVRGQIAIYGVAPVRHVVFGGGGYVVPRADGRLLAGSTAEHAGFMVETTDDGLATVRRVAGAIAPSLREIAPQAAWAGLRPMTPDGLPIIGSEPGAPRMVYACGHSRNGILLAPATAMVVADIVEGVAPRHDVTPFRAERFPG